jgi:hypothetical protein
MDLSHSPNVLLRVWRNITQGLVAGTSLPRSHKLQDGDACSGIQSRTLYIAFVWLLSSPGAKLEMANFSSIRRVVVQGLKMHACWNRFLENDLHCMTCENIIYG